MKKPEVDSRNHNMKFQLQNKTTYELDREYVDSLTLRFSSIALHF